MLADAWRRARWGRRQYYVVLNPATNAGGGSSSLLVRVRARDLRDLANGALEKLGPNEPGFFVALRTGSAVVLSLRKSRLATWEADQRNISQ
jgi:hypothetical protein